MRTYPVLTAALVSLLCATTNADGHKNASYTGGIQAFINATSLHTILDDFATVMPDFIERESDFSFDFDLSNGFIYDMRINGIKIKKLDIKNRTIKILPGDKHQTFHAEISNVDLTGHVTGGLEVGIYQMFNFTEMTVTGLTIRVDIGIVHDKNNTAYWQITGASVIDFHDLYMNTDSVVLNTALEVFH